MTDNTTGDEVLRIWVIFCVYLLDKAWGQHKSDDTHDKCLDGEPVRFSKADDVLAETPRMTQHHPPRSLNMSSQPKDKGTFHKAFVNL